jgi:hypothetical protein
MQAIAELRSTKAPKQEFSAGESVFSIEHNMQGRILGVIRPSGLCIVGVGALGSAGIEPDQLRAISRTSWFERFSRKAA